MVFEISNNTTTQGVNGTKKKDDPEKLKREARARGEFIVKLSTDDTNLSAIAKKFNMSLTEFKNMTGLTKDALTKGQTIKNVPTAKIQAGMGLMSVAKAHGMTFEQFCTLNNIDKNYKPQKDESFYVFKTEEKKNPKMKSDQIAKTLEDKAADLRGAVGKEEFDNVFNEIDEGNVLDVVKKYQEDNNKSLINMISDEWSSDKEVRKAAMTKIFDLVAEKKHVASDEVREEFIAELDSQFKSWGRVSTKKLDAIIDNMINPPEEKPDKPKVEGAVNKPAPPIPTGNKARVRLGNGKVLTSEELKLQADRTAMKEKRPVKRPEPVLDKNGNIVADVKVYEPTAKGALTGKTIIINAGHGGYNPKTGDFDPGTFASDSNNKIIEEWYKNKNFTDEIVPKLTAKGAKIIFMNGAASSIMKAKAKYKDADMFISIHCDAAPNNKNARGQTIIFREGDNQDKKLANAVEARVETHNWLDKKTCKSKANNGLGVLKAASKMPSILIETGFQSNEKDLANIDSKKFRTEFADLLVEGIIDYTEEK